MMEARSSLRTPEKSRYKKTDTDNQVEWEKKLLKKFSQHITKDHKSEWHKFTVYISILF